MVFCRPFVVAAAIACASACGDKTSTATAPSAPTALSLAGMWTGDLVLQATSTRMTWTLSQVGTGVTGSVLVGLPNGTVLLNGSLNGTITGSTLAYTIAVQPGGIPSQPTCTGQLGGTVSASGGASPTTLSGSYSVTSSTCTTPFSSGSFTLAKQ